MRTLLPFVGGGVLFLASVLLAGSPGQWTVAVMTGASSPDRVTVLERRYALQRRVWFLLLIPALLALALMSWLRVTPLAEWPVSATVVFTCVGVLVVVLFSFRLWSIATRQELARLLAENTPQ